MTEFLLSTHSTCGVLKKGKHCTGKPYVLVKGLTKDGDVVMCEACIAALRRRKSKVLNFKEYPLPSKVPLQKGE
jgi:hypothetical protein